jgi:hypothetical protein
MDAFPPPSTPPVSLDPPGGPAEGGPAGPRRGRMALVALATAGLVGGGIVVVGQFVAADGPTLRSAPDESSSVTVDDDESEDSEDEPAGQPSDDDGDDGDGGGISGEIVIDDGDGDPFVIDLGAMGPVLDCLGLSGPDGSIFGPHGDGPRRGPLFDDDFAERMEEFLDDLPVQEWLDLELGDLHGDDGVRIFGSGGSTVTVVGPDGVEVIDLGEGDATVTIEQTDGEIDVTTEGDAEVGELPDLGDMLPRLDELDPGELPDLGKLLPFDLDEIEACLDDAIEE